MKVILLGEQSQISQSIQQRMLAQPQAFETPELLRWRDGADCLQALSAATDFLVVPVTQADVPAAAQSLFREVFLALCEQCAQLSIAVVLISDPQVFDPDISYPVAEDELITPQSEYGKWLVDIEQQLRRYTEQHIILRTSWVYGPAGDNFLTNVIRRAEQATQLCFNPETRAGPTSILDLARVCVAIILQLDTGANAWGAYHYCSSDISTPYQFAEAIIAVASQYDRQLDENQICCVEDAENADPEFEILPVVLDCHKILEAFGIKQRPWRASLSSVIKQYFAENVPA